MFIATISVAPEGFALARTLEEAPDVEVEAERIAAHSTEWVMPCLWVAGGDRDALDGALKRDPTVEEVVAASGFDDETYYQVAWDDAVVRHVDAAVDREASVLNAEVVDGEWHLRLRFVSREQFETFREYLDDRDLTYRLRALAETTTPRQERGELTAPQRDALVAAVEAGYFAIPREATLAEVAGALGISEQATSERIRRGIDRLVRTVLTTSD